MNKRLWPALLLCVVMLFGTMLQGCSPSGVVVGKVGKESITVKDVNVFVDYQLMQISAQYGTVITRDQIPDAATLKNMNTGALDTAVTLNLVMQKAKEMKLYPLLSSDQKTIDDQVTKAAASLAQYGLTKDDYTQLLTQIKVYQLVLSQTIKGASATDDEVKAAYDADVASQKDSFTKDASAYEKAKATTDGSVVVVYKPDGYRYVKHILITMPDDIAKQITTAQQNGDTAAVKTLRDKGLPLIKAKADEVLAKVKAGEDFDALMAQYGQDPGMQQEPDKTTGYELGSATSFMQEFKDAALALAAVGDTTELVPTDYGYHIIKWVGNVPSGPVAFDDVKDAEKTKLLQKKKDDLWNAAVAQWKTEIKVEQYPDKIPAVLATVAATASK